MSGFKVVMDFEMDVKMLLSRAQNTVCYIIKCLHIHSDHFSAQMALGYYLTFFLHKVKTFHMHFTFKTCHCWK